MLRAVRQAQRGLASWPPAQWRGAARGSLPALRQPAPSSSSNEVACSRPLPPWSGPSHALGGFFLLIPHPFTAPPALCQAGGGGCFPVHYDSDERLDARRLTAILYLNPGWSVPQHGGAVRLYPWPAAPVDVAPLAGRLLLFSSTRMAHRRAH